MDKVKIMSITSDENSLWEPCPPGELQRLGNRLGRQRRVRIAKRAASVVALLLIAVSGVYLSIGQRPEKKVPAPGEFNFGGITCAEIHDILPQLKDGTLEEPVLTRVRNHIDECPHCKSLSRFLKQPVHTSELPCTDPLCPQHHSRTFALR